MFGFGYSPKKSSKSKMPSDFTVCSFAFIGAFGRCSHRTSEAGPGGRGTWSNPVDRQDARWIVMDPLDVHNIYPRRSMYAIYAYIGVVWGVNVGIYSIHGVYGYSMS